GVALWQHAEQRGDAQGRAQAADLLRQAVLDYLSPRNADFLDDAGVRKLVRDLVFATYVDAMAQRGGMQALLTLGVADHLRSGVTPQAMADAAIRAAANDPALADLVRQEQDARNELRAIQESLRASEAGEAPPPEAALRLRNRSADLERLRQQLQERIRDRFPGYDQLVRPPVPSFTDVAQRLGRDEAFVMLTPTARALYVWAITADEAPLFARVDVTAANLAQLVTRVRRTVDIGLMQGRLIPFDAAAAHELHRHLLAPVAPRLKSQRHLIIAASGPLAMLPFATLHTAPAAQGAGKKGPESLPWLVRQVSVTQVPSVSAWLALRQLPRSHPAPEPLLAWGDPAFALKVASPPKRPAAPRQLAVTRRTQPPEATAAAPAVRYDELPPLPETRDELIAIARALKANVDRDVVLGAKATRDSVLAANREGQLARKRVVAFATHGLVAGDLPGLQQPALAMAAAGSTAEPLRLLLTLDDVLTLKLNADWVVLSACNTAAAEGKAGEALSGLARGFFYAGARTLLVTQWAVETESAVLLTTSTFAYYTANPNASKAESLRQAMLKVMQTPGYEHPAFWAPYTLVGDGGR
ncbi:MAG TPA: CHAT domain-containing protein, partial [Burkholderiaceae bacterium]|nr:CHAT domain-containing protein [Burkholderiaceae bacterium]